MSDADPFFGVDKLLEENHLEDVSKQKAPVVEDTIGDDDDDDDDGDGEEKEDEDDGHGDGDGDGEIGGGTLDPADVLAIHDHMHVSDEVNADAVVEEWTRDEIEDGMGMEMGMGMAIEPESVQDDDVSSEEEDGDGDGDEAELDVDADAVVEEWTREEICDEDQVQTMDHPHPHHQDMTSTITDHFQSTAVVEEWTRQQHDDVNEESSDEECSHSDGDGDGDGDGPENTMNAVMSNAKANVEVQMGTVEPQQHHAVHLHLQEQLTQAQQEIEALEASLEHYRQQLKQSRDQQREFQEASDADKLVQTRVSMV